MLEQFADIGNNTYYVEFHEADQETPVNDPEVIATIVPVIHQIANDVCESEGTALPFKYSFSTGAFSYLAMGAEGDLIPTSRIHYYGTREPSQSFIHRNSYTSLTDNEGIHLGMRFDESLLYKSLMERGMLMMLIPNIYELNKKPLGFDDEDLMEDNPIQSALDLYPAHFSYMDWEPIGFDVHVLSLIKDNVYHSSFNSSGFADPLFICHCKPQEGYFNFPDILTKHYLNYEGIVKEYEALQTKYTKILWLKDSGIALPKVNGSFFDILQVPPQKIQAV